MTNEIQREMITYLATHQVMTLATVGSEGVWAAAVFYVHHGVELFFLSAGHTRHAQNIASHPQVAATIQEDYSDWTDIKGIQLEGIVTLLDGTDKQAAMSLYKQRYKFLTHAPQPIQQAIQKVNWYKLTPSRIYFVDNSKGFGHRDEIFLG